ncbi:hypothetical protein PR202_gb21072 [Eleusine coracana subsp. coracana]|uniref:Uncharacterized protein n=1 Tax=Eleusine coracana subsp. coracana TaxID=191504 RepID=A0AAV5FD24_ELECO|nr:hypothetical protein PR202_gb21072 [Eleusine coracana subsp. coracana]
MAEVTLLRSGHRPSWADIPQDLSGMVLRVLLPACADRARFAASCADYKAAACGRWLVFPRDEGCFLVDPFTRATVELPALSHGKLYAVAADDENLLVINISQDPSTGDPEVPRFTNRTSHQG